MKYRVTKTYGNERGLSCAFRQWRADSHCNLIHGYSLGFRFVFEAAQLDDRNWVYDFGNLGFVKEFLSLTKWFISAYLSYLSFEKAKIVLSGFLKDTAILDVIAAATVFILVFIILSIIFNFLSKILSIKGIDFIDLINLLVKLAKCRK